MKASLKNKFIALGLIAIGVSVAAAGIYLGETDDAPGAGLLGILLMIGAVVLGVRIARRKTKPRIIDDVHVARSRKTKELK